MFPIGGAGSVIVSAGGAVSSTSVCGAGFYAHVEVRLTRTAAAAYTLSVTAG